MFRYKNKSSYLLFESLRKHTSEVLTALVLVVIVSSLESTSAVLIAPLMSAVSNVSIDASQLPSFFLSSIEKYNSLNYEWRLYSSGITILAVVVLKNIAAYILGVVFYSVELNVAKDLRLKCAARFLALNSEYYTRVQTGKNISYLNEHPQRCQLLVNSFIQFFKDGLIAIFLLIVLFAISAQLTIATIVLFGLLAFAIRFTLNKVRYFSKDAARELEHYVSILDEILQGIGVIKAFSTEKLEFDRLNTSLDRKVNADLKAFSYTIITPLLTETLGTAVMLSILVCGAIFLNGSVGLSLPLLLTYTFTLLRLLPKLVQLNNLRSQYSLFGSSLDALFVFLETTKPQVEENIGTPYQTCDAALDKAIAFKGVEFRFPSNKKLTLTDITLDIPRGCTTAFVGPSGSGKSTLISLLLRLYEPTDGEIIVGGRDFREYNIKSWRKRIAVVQQDTFLFNASILENIAYGSSNATELSIIKAAKKAYAYDFIQQLPDGFNTVIGNRGTLLSGGQRQRIAIARAILRDPDILILDEATSALDSNSERIVQKAIEEVSFNRTVIVVAHRLSTVERANQIVVMQSGTIVEKGTHQSLLEAKNTYYSLYKLQSGVQAELMDTVS